MKTELEEMGLTLGEAQASGRTQWHQLIMNLRKVHAKLFLRFLGSGVSLGMLWALGRYAIDTCCHLAKRGWKALKRANGVTTPFFGRVILW